MSNSNIFYKKFINFLDLLYLSHSAFIHSNLAFLSFQEGDEVSQKSEEENINIIQEESTKPNNMVNLANSYYSSFLKSGMCIDFSNETFIFFYQANDVFD